ncbi:FecR domain-containing protein [Sphingomonas sp. dw_22]|uniref:FecR family protein n=1 Tax=Sphingomonas sp. dw_22 TaxID=2721175 RepID=UPI001BD4AEB3|nr:FecR domain-containing protein [Sphingomonas sp. dw_22]
MATSGGKSVEKLEAEAAAWAAKLDAAPDQAPPGLDEWFAQDPRHAGALLRAQATLAVFAPPWHESVPDIEKQAEDDGPASAWKRRAIFGGGALALAASLAAVLLIGSPKETYETQIGEVRSLALSDGSSVSIDAKSRIEIDFDAKNRDVHFRSGKVLFRAAHNAQRPFRVMLDGIVITDIGTAFQVTKDDRTQAVEVLVTEGAVRIDAPAGRVDLVAGQRARFPQAASGGLRPELTRVAPADIERTLAWKDGQLELNGETLDSAVAEINRHSRLQLRVGNAALGSESLYGSFRMDDAAGFARAVAAGLGTDVRTEADGIVIGAGKK